ncbi:MAG TPA: ABC transporter substrate-binding protein [Syntrophorhabdaceae bacterium]|nr:ABC transporter substrate-binding protein [Syntrophorhabdaceae bacterium]
MDRQMTFNSMESVGLLVRMVHRIDAFRCCFSGGISVLSAVLAVVCVVLLGVCVEPLHAAEPKPSYGGILRISDAYDGTSIGYPPKLVRVYSSRQAAPAVETLFRTDKTGKPIPWLVEKEKDDPKGNRVLLTVRKGVKFHDGTDFNAEAVRWNLSQCLAAKTQGTEKLKSVDVVDEYTVQINLTEWDNALASNLAQPLGMMVSPAACKKNGEEWCAGHPIGTGPFQFVSWIKDGKTIYKKFPGYWQKGKPYLDGVEWIPIVDQTTREFSLRTRELDLMLANTAKGIKGLEKDGFLVSQSDSGSGGTCLIFDSANPRSPFADVRVRRAVVHAIDSRAITNTVFFGMPEAMNQFSYKGHWGYNPSVIGYPYNPDKAKRLLAEAGYQNGFKTTILYRTNPEWDQAFAAVQSFLKSVGIEAELDQSAPGRYDQIAFRGGKWEGLIVNAVPSNPDLAAALASNYNGGGSYYAQMSIPADYSTAVQKAITAPNFKTKQKYTGEAMKLMIDKYCMVVPLVSRRDIAVTRKGVQNHGFCESPNNGLWTPEAVWIER